MPALYLGEKTDWIQHLKELLDEPLVAVNNSFKIRSFIFENFYSIPQPIFIFIESKDKERAKRWIDELKKNRIKNIFLILVTEKMPASEVIECFTYGINEIIDISVSKEGLQQMLNVLPRLKKQNAEQTEIRLFKLPLWKRIFDIVFTSIALLFLSPLFILTAIAIRLESKGPAIYASQRVGSNYKIFGFLKFRSMYADADKRLEEFKKLNQYQITEPLPEEIQAQETKESTGIILVGDDFRLSEKEYLDRRKKLKANNFVKIQNDPRITRVGKIIRKYSIDELPQLFNILKGNMSIVGNRPLPLYEAEALTSDDYIERFMAPAGLTGLWQVEKRGTEGILSAEERKQLDIQYARKFSFLFDMKIILRTFRAFIQKENV